MKKGLLTLLACAWVFGFCYILAMGFISAFRGEATLMAFLLGFVIFFWVMTSSGGRAEAIGSFISWPIALLELIERAEQYGGDSWY
jgi:hypothetical protein